MYLRFITAEIDEDSQQPLGVFHVAYRLRDSGELEEWEQQQVEELLIWFREHLPIPDRFTSAKPPYYRKRSNAISWLKDTALQHLSQLRRLVALLERHSINTQILVTNRPGYVVYEDEYQVTAEPFADTV
jgi:hypothetical protein